MKCGKRDERSNWEKEINFKCKTKYKTRLNRYEIISEK